MSWFDRNEASRMRELYVQVLESSKFILNTQRLAGKDTSKAEATVKLYTRLLEDADRRLKSIKKEETSDQP